MVIAKIQWSNENGYEQQPTTTTIVESAVISTLAEKPIITTAVRMMTTAIATVENDILAATTTPTTTTTTTITSTSTHMTPSADKTLNETSKIHDLIVSENDLVEGKVELETSEIVCDKTDKLLLDDVKTTTTTVQVTDNNSEMKENDEEEQEQQQQLLKTLNVNNINNNNNNNVVVVNNDDMNSMLECDSNTNTLQNNQTTTNIGLSNNWLSTTEQNGQPQTTESFLSGLGVDISSLSKTLNLPQTTASKLYALNDELNTISKTSNNNTYDISNNLAANNAVVSENGQAKIILLCESNSHPFQARTIMLTPNIECKVGRLIAKSKASETNAIFDCKVLSRNHAVLWYTPEDQKFWVKDTKSSNGTFINDQKLGNEAAELHFGDVVKFGVDVVENSRKEVHGCIIASVKLYLPDGREAISADALHNGRSAYSGEKCITYDELHRLNLYVQEVSNREKNLKSKLFNIQNLLDATRKNSGLCWQALIAEDQLLHRIHMLEKKLQVMEKNVPESSLRSEVIKLLEDKNLYQQQAKETLQKVYQERCEALQLYAKTEADKAQAENECKLLREQVMTGKQTLQEVSNRLLQLETEYIEFKEEVQRQQQEEREVKEEETARSLALTKLLHEREMECEDLKNKLSLLMLEAANKYQEEVARLDELKAVEKIDAAIADMDLGEDDDDDEDDEDDGVGDADELDKLCYNDEFTNKSASYNGVDVVQLNNSKNERKLAENGEKINDNTIMKWLKNSDLNKKEGSSDIMKAICNESDSSDEADAELLPPVKKSKSLQSAYNSLLELEKNISQELETDAQHIIEHVKPPAYDEAKKPFVQLKESVALLRTVYNEIIIAQEQGEKEQLKLEPQLTLKEEEAETEPTEPTEIALLQEKLKSYEADWQNNMELLQGEKESYKQKVLELTQQVEMLREEKQALEQNQLEAAASASASETPISSTATTPTRSTVTPAHEEFHDDEILSDMLVDNSAEEREEELIMYKENLEQSRLVNSELRREMNELKAKFEKHMLAGGAGGQGALCTSRVLLRYILPYGAAAAVAVLCWLSTYF